MILNYICKHIKLEEVFFNIEDSTIELLSMRLIKLLLLMNLVSIMKNKGNLNKHKTTITCLIKDIYLFSLRKTHFFNNISSFKNS